MNSNTKYTKEKIRTYGHFFTQTVKQNRQKKKQNQISRFLAYGWGDLTALRTFQWNVHTVFLRIASEHMGSHIWPTAA